MLHPSYTDLINAVNSGVEPGEEPVVQSRYSIVIATAKRARQLIAGEEPMVSHAYNKKPLSVAVEELYESKVKILSEDDYEDYEGGAEQAGEQEALRNEAGLEDTADETSGEDKEGADSPEADQEA